MARYSHSIEQRKQLYNCEANSWGVVWCGVAIMNGQIVNAFTW